MHHSQPEPVLDRVSLAIGPSELIGLIGPNGGGKSTLLAALTGRIQPSAGQVVGSPSIGLVLASPGLYPALSVRENLTWFAALSAPSGWNERLTVLTGELGLTDVLDRPAGTLSSGQAQRVALVRALVAEPQLLVLDEPTANIDPRSAADIHERLRAEADGGRAVLLCTHDLRAAESICDRVLYLDRKILAERRPTRTSTTSDLLALFPSVRSDLPAPFPSPQTRTPGRAALTREWLELRRHPATFGVAVLLFAGVGVLGVSSLVLLERLSDPAYQATLGTLIDQDPRAFLAVASSSARTGVNFLLFSQYLGFIGVLAAHAWLHERQLGTLPFLETSGVPRSTFVNAKALAVWIPLTLALWVTTTLTEGCVYLLGSEAPTYAWWLRTWVTQPLWGLGVAYAGLVLSGRARDVRQAQQWLWFGLFGLQSTVALGIAQTHDDPGFQIAFACLGAGVVAGCSMWERTTRPHNGR